MANRLGPLWLNQVQRFAGPTHTGRLSKYAVLAERINALEPVLERETDAQLAARSQALRLKRRDLLQHLAPLRQPPLHRPADQRQHLGSQAGGNAVDFESCHKTAAAQSQAGRRLRKRRANGSRLTARATPAVGVPLLLKSTTPA